MDTQKQQIVDRLKQANNILVTVKSNPTVDHLAACIGLTLALNKMGKHATAVFSGDVPSTIEFLQPEKTLEKNTDSLRDFIIALDKSKADKLRYKVEEKVVKIFITPYKTSISDKDLNFSQGDFNVDVVLALGVHQQEDVDQAIVAHGRILHDATVISVNVAAGPALGSINWTRPTASSLSELAVEVVDGVDKRLLDGQIATAFLTGIVSETDRFSNNRTTPQTMSISAELMAVGANQQLVATKLAEPPAPVAPATPGDPNEATATPPPDDGTLEIEHEDSPHPPQIAIDEEGGLHIDGTEPEDDEAKSQEDNKSAMPDEPAPESAAKDESGQSLSEPEPEPEKEQSEAEKAGLPPPPELPQIKPEHTEGPHMILEPPAMGGDLSAATSSEFFDPLTDAASGAPPNQPLLNREPLGAHHEVNRPIAVPAAPAASQAASQPAAPATPPPATAVSLPAPAPSPSVTVPPADDVSEATLSDIEKQLHSPHVDEAAAAGGGVPSTAPLALSDARDAVAQAVSTTDASQPLPPIAALNAQPVDLTLHPTATTPTAAAPAPNPAPFAPDGLSLPGVTGATDSPITPADAASQNAAPQDPNAPPPVPPPMLPPLQN